MAAGWGPSSTIRQLAGKVAIITGAAQQIAAEHRPVVRANMIGPGSSDGAGDSSTNTTGAVIPCDGGPAAFR